MPSRTTFSFSNDCAFGDTLSAMGQDHTSIL